MNSVSLYLIVIILILLGIYFYFRSQKTENFTPYTYGPYNYMTTGSDPLSFYRYPIYRQPYMFPYQYYTNYPYPYMTYGDVNI